MQGCCNYLLIELHSLFTDLAIASMNEHTIGDRTSEGIVDFLKHATGMPLEAPEPAAASHHELGPVGVHVPPGIQAQVMLLSSL